MRIGPVAFLFVAVGGWVAVRALMFWPQPEADLQEPNIAWAAPFRAAKPADVFRQVLVVPDCRPGAVEPITLQPRTRVSPILLAFAPEAEAQDRGEAGPAPGPATVTPIHAPLPPAIQLPAGRNRFSLSSWTIVRSSGTRGLAAAGQLGGSQAGVRLRYDLGFGLALAARLSGSLRERRGKEAAVALDWRPLGALPVTFTIERRAGLDRGGRDAFAAGVFGGFDRLTLPLGFSTDGYAQAGVVGLKRRDLYADGALRVERKLAGAGRVRIGVGAGLWGGAQPGMSRLDAGPQVVAHAPLGRASIRIGAEWRQRIAGNARPGSGPTLTIGADF
ncbi:MAG: hypothetical protein JSS05_13060 [Proteobacteria bacterium]|nr:hypothetical protein [Pseudomonadota bacterium]